MTEESNRLVDKNGNYLIPINEKAESYFIIDFLRRNYKTAIPILSGILAVVTAVINYLGYLANKIYLTFWCIPSAMVEGTTDSFFHTFLPLLLLVIAQFVQYFGMSLLYPKIAHMTIIKEKSREFIKKVRSLKRKRHNVSKEHDEYTIVWQEYQEYKHETRPQYFKIKIGLIIQVVLLHLPILSVYFFLFFSDNVLLLKNTVLITLFLMLPYLLWYYLLKRIIVFRYKKNKRKLKSLSPKTTKERLYEVLSDRKIKTFCAMFVFYFVIYIAVSLVYLPTCLAQSKDYYITTFEEVPYVLVYSDNTRTVFEKAEISGNSLQIDKSIQQYCDNSSDVTLQKKHFDTVRFIEPYREAPVHPTQKQITELYDRIRILFKTTKQKQSN